MRDIRISLFLMVFALASCVGQIGAGSATDQQINGPTPLSRDAIDTVIYEQLENQGAFEWHMVDDLTLWSAITYDDYVVSVGYRDQSALPFANTAPRQALHRVNLQDPAWTAARAELLELIGGSVTQTIADDAPSATTAGLLFEDNVLPVLDVRVTSFDTLVALRKHPNVRYVEPIGYQTADQVTVPKSPFGCGAPNTDVRAEDFTSITPDAKVPWNFLTTNIPEAWALSTGRGITVAVIDTGVGANQPKLGAEFTEGESADRTLESFGTFQDDGVLDDCGHGTAMAGVIAAPRGSGGASVGVAYGANLVTIRGTDDVVIGARSEKRGVADALTLAADREDIKIISISLGDVLPSGRVADAIRYAHDRGKLIFAAAGTSLPILKEVGVIFPANMNETVAVTGIKDGDEMKSCVECHRGKKVDFVVVMQRESASSRNSLSLTRDGNAPRYIGGSSIATATMAGIAALVWSRNPSLSRAEVIEVLKQASLLFPERDDKFGFGTVDAALAVSLVE